MFMISACMSVCLRFFFARTHADLRRYFSPSRMGTTFWQSPRPDYMFMTSAYVSVHLRLII